jgi:hypothetical protein
MPTTQPPHKKLKTANGPEKPVDKVAHCPCCPKFQEWRETANEEFSMPKGEYYVGDLSLVLRPELDCEVLGENGLFELSDGRVVGTFTHEGCQDNDRADDIDFHVPSDVIGITLLAGLEEQWVDPKSWEAELGWGHFGTTLKAISDSGRKITMMDYVKHAGAIVVYDTDFDCQTSTASHYKHDDHVTSTTFGDKININTYHGSYNSDDGSDEEVDTATDDEPEAEADPGV